MLFRCCPAAHLPGPLQDPSYHLLSQKFYVWSDEAPRLTSIPIISPSISPPRCGQVWSSVVSTRSPSRLTPRTLHLWPLQSGFCEICSCANVLQFNIFCFLKGEGVERGHLDMRNQDRTRYHCSENVFCKLYVLYTVYCNTEIGMFSIHKRWKNVQTLQTRLCYFF